MNKKKRIANKKHRKNQARLHALHAASLKKAKKKIVEKPKKEETPEIIEATKDNQVEVEKTPAKKAPAKKAPAKKAPAKKKSVKKATTKKK